MRMWIDRDSWFEVFSTLQKNILRTGMTAWGIFWGTFMLVLMLGFGAGLEDGVARNMLGFAGNNVYLWGRHTTMPFKGMTPGRWVRLSVSDMEALASVPGVDAVSPTFQLGGWRDGVNINVGPIAGNFAVKGEYPTFPKVVGFHPYAGRFINQMDIAERRKICVIGEQVRRILFPNDELPLGRMLQIQGVYFRVVGVFSSPQPGDEGERNNTTVYIPFSTLQAAFNTGDQVGSFAVVLKEGSNPDQTEEQLRNVLQAVHGVHPDDRQAIGSFNLSEKRARVSNLFTGIHVFIWVVCIATLLAGALGVSNIMLISVKERTREFGVRKALGATPGSIVRLVLQEATVLTALSGYLGLIAGVAALEAVPYILGSGQTGPLSAPSIDLRVAFIATAFLAVAGALAGAAPARHAARIHPIVALRSE